ncbi:hypothetical protein BC826DRAFT_1022621 [Russula brevipes]|nr:hypothetical protein BC826DRAFT_1022621 [Russula brevipes]
MFNFRPSASQRLYHSHFVYPNDLLYSPYPSSHSPSAALEARAEARRQERARLLQVRIARAHQEQQEWQVKRALAEEFWRTAVRPQEDADAEGSAHVNQLRHARFKAPEPDDRSVPDLESVLRERLQKIAGGDEEMQDLARSLLRHVTSTSGIGRPSAAASSPEINMTQPPEGADLSRSDALHGTAPRSPRHLSRPTGRSSRERRACWSLRRTKTPQSSLTVIQNVRSALAKLTAGFALPSSLDFSDDEPDGLAYTRTNVPLLARLDAVETDGEEEVRMLRRAAVKEVEKAIEDVERRVREVREDAKSANVAKDKDILDVAHPELSDDNDTKPKAEESSPSVSDGRLDSYSSMPESLSVPVFDATPLDRAPVSESVPQVVAVATPRLAVADQGDGFRISADDDLGATHEVAPEEEGTTDQTTTVSSRFTTPLESPAGVSTPILGAIAPSSTPVSPALSSSSIDPEDVFAFLEHGHDQYSALVRPEGEDDTSLDDADDDHEWTEIEA